ncbi:MAG: dUTP diphosphatase [Roseovarius sp.]|nr:dUTP diphosphatase [Roseovarius sp.]MCY4291160.1 dUTP diphosphatase [Roseovarius sp.]
MVTVHFAWEAWADTSMGMPCRETKGAAGVDLRANLRDRGTLRVRPGERKLVSTGIRVAVPGGYEIQVRPRSGLALRHGITIANSPGTIDSDYRGPLGVIVLNAGGETFEITHGMRIAQMVVAPVVSAAFEVATCLDETERAASGFGSTGTA